MAFAAMRPLYSSIDLAAAADGLQEHYGRWVHQPRRLLERLSDSASAELGGKVEGEQDAAAPLRSLHMLR